MSDATIREVESESGLYEAAMKPIVLVGGKGGVGKTTVAAALALAIAGRYPERKVLLLSTDPAHSLSDAIGEGDRSSPPNLKIWELEAGQVFAEFRRRHRKGLRLVASRGTFLSERDLEQFLDLGMPGLDELTALQVIADTAAAGKFDHLIVDTAPTGHTLRLLELPEILEGWREALHALMAKHRVMSELYSGEYVPDEADAFIAALERIVNGVRKILSDPVRTVFLPVMNPDPLSLWETKRLLVRLKELRIESSCVVLNKVCNPGAGCDACLHRHRRDAVWIARARAELLCGIVEVRYAPDEPRGPRALTSLGESLLSGDSWRLTPDPVQPEDAVEGAALEPLRRPRPNLEGASVFLVCGKGGVGKTTVACALAAHLAAAAGGKVLLFSTDPAHSLSDAIGVRIGESPREIAAGLHAVEIDPEARLAEMRESYVEEIEEFFGTFCRPGLVDVSLDREAMSRLIHLAPPGLDEIMALSELARYVQEGKYDRFVIDTAPTGHFLRLLELPDMIRDWIRAIFNIFLKYKMLRAPKFQTFLVQLSKAMRVMEATLADRNRSLLIPVAIPTELSFEETGDLLRRSGELGFAPNFGVLNHVVFASNGCSHCAARAAMSRQFGGHYRKGFPGVPFLRLEEQAQSPTGMASLSRIGNELFGEEGRP